MKNTMRTILNVIFIIIPCILFAENNFVINNAGYIATDNTDEFTSVDVAPDGTIVTCGKLYNYLPSDAVEYNLLGGGNGTIVRLNHTGSKVLSITRVGDNVHDLEVSDNGDIAICGTFGVGVLKSDGSQFKWVDNSILVGTVDGHTPSFFGYFAPSSFNMKYRRAMSRVAIGSDGTVATIQQKEWYGDPGLYIYNSNGVRILDSILPHKDTVDFGDKIDYEYFINVYPNDICVDGANNSVIIGGWNGRKDDSPQMSDHPIHMPYLRCYDYSGQLKWKNYDWRAKDIFYTMNYYADSRFSDIVIGRDGFLYTAGYIHGGDHMFEIDPHDYSKWADNCCSGYDSYSMPHSMGAGIDHAFFCKYDPETGDILNGQAAIVRENPNGTGEPNQSQIKGLMADEDGKLYLAGYCMDYIKNRSLQTINGESVGSNAGVEPFIMIVDSSWNNREIWTVVSKNNLEGTFWGLGYRNGIMAAAGEIFQGEAITTPGGTGQTRHDNYDGYLLTYENPNTPVQKDEMLEHKQEFIIWPNPASDIIYFSRTAKEVKILNVHGAVILKKKNADNINIWKLNPGIYFIYLDGNIEKLIIE